MPRPAEPDDDLPPAESARARRRDHEADAGARAGMRTGLAKQFKQVLDVQVKRAREVDDGPLDERPADGEQHPHHHRHRHEP